MVMIVASVVQAGIIYISWPWFAESLGVPALANFWHALGLSFLIGTLTSDRLANQIEKAITEVTGDRKTALALGISVTLPIVGCIAVVIMWAIASFGRLT